MDIWEANSIDTAFTAHVCRQTGQVKCNGTTCGDIGPNRYSGIEGDLISGLDFIAGLSDIESYHSYP